jgi:hypothetical protein
MKACALGRYIPYYQRFCVTVTRTPRPFGRGGACVCSGLTAKDLRDLTDSRFVNSPTPVGFPLTLLSVTGEEL